MSNYILQLSAGYSDAGINDFQPDGSAICAWTSDKQAERFDGFLLALPCGDQRVYSNGRSLDAEREGAFQRGVCHAVAEVTLDNFHDLPINFGCQLSKVKTEATVHFADTGERPRERQLEIDFWRGAHHAAYDIRENVYRLSDLSDDDDEVLEHYLDSLDKQLPEEYEGPDFEPSQEVLKFMVERSPEIVAKVLVKKHKQATQAKKTEPQMDSKYDVPGFVGDVMRLTLDTAPYPNVPLAFCGAISLQSVLVARKVQFEGLTPNIYAMAIANSGSGKEWIRKVNNQLLTDAGMAHVLADAFASGEGLEDAMHQQPAMLFQTDEIDGVVRSMGGGGETRHESMKAMLLKLFTSSASIYHCRRKASDEGQRSIYKPSLTLLGTCVPSAFYESVSQAMMTSGLVARMIVVDGGQRGEGQRPKEIETPPEIQCVLEYWRDFNGTGGNLGTINPVALEIPVDDAGSRALNDLRKLADESYRKAEIDQDEGACAVWARCYEQAVKLSILYACSESPSSPAITEASVEWSGQFVTEQVHRMLRAVLEASYESPFDRLANRLARKIAASEAGIGHSKLLKFSKVDSKQFDLAIRTLKERGQIADFIDVSDSGRSSIVYVTKAEA